MVDTFFLLDKPFILVQNTMSISFSEPIIFQAVQDPFNSIFSFSQDIRRLFKLIFDFL